nr:FAM151B-like protein [Biomphalaria glabrata]
MSDKRLLISLNEPEDPDLSLKDVKTKAYSAQRQRFNKWRVASIVVTMITIVTFALLCTYWTIRPSSKSIHLYGTIGCLQFFDVDNDASKIRWKRDVNSKQEIKNAMKNDKVQMISGDVVLKHQPMESKTLIPMMGKLTSNNSDITLKEWLLEVSNGKKGIRLHIHSPDALEISFQLLRDFNVEKPITFPVWVHADVLQGPFGEKPSVDMKDFITLQKKYFPSCTLSFGWTTGSHTDLSQSAYSWDTVWDMLNLIQDGNIQNEIIFQVRLSLVHNSVPQLKWLIDNVKSSSLMVWHEEGDSVVTEDIMYISYKFPPNTVYFNLNHDRFQLLLDNYRHFSKDKVDPHVMIKDQRAFKHEDWWKMGFHRQKNSVLPSTVCIILTTPLVYLTSKSKYLSSSDVSIQGRITFFNRDNREAESHVTGLNIYIRPLQYDRFDNITGIRCFIGFGGEIEVAGVNLPDNIENFGKAARVTPTHTNCYRFKIVDEGTQILFWVTSLHDCTTLESVSDPDSLTPLLTVPIPTTLLSREPHPFVIKMEDVKRQVLIDELRIKQS